MAQPAHPSDSSSTVRLDKDDLQERSTQIQTSRNYSVRRDLDANKTYATRQDSQGNVFEEEICNFVWEVTEVLVDDEDKYLTLAIYPEDEENYTVTVSTQVFNDPRKFRREVCTGIGTSFQGSQSDLSELRKLVNADSKSAPTKERTQKLGLHHEGDRDGYSVVLQDEVINLTQSATRDSSYSHDALGTSFEKRVGIQEAEMGDDVERVMQLLPETRDGNNVLKILAWYYASAAAPVVRENEGEFPLLSITGRAGAGKTALLEKLQEAFAAMSKLDRANATEYTLMRGMSASRSIPLALDEYKPSDWSKHRKKSTQELLKAVTRGSWESKGNADGDDDYYKLEAPVVLNGEEALQGSAQNRRAVLVQLKKDSKRFEEWSELNQLDVESHAKFAHRAVTYIDLDKAWEEATRKVDEQVDGHGMEITKLYTLRFGAEIYRRMAEEAGIQVPVNEADWDDVIQEVHNESGDENRVEHEEEFLQIFGRAAASRDVVADTHFTIRTSDDNEYLHIDESAAYDAVSKYVKDHDLGGYDLLDHPKDYKNRFRELADEDDSYVVKRGHKDHTVGRCVRIDLDKLEDKTEVDCDAIREAY